ncbi:unnamed protein product [Oikopleura dioica]|uniref:Aminopeptidase P N-terminal domain-containing protein n=2 Tax=Oikopleura dioica TaxID=34765 RepID=E4XB30_OIKDI|nr:unnamed protein product [Oikopleura dioica]
MLRQFGQQFLRGSHRRAQLCPQMTPWTHSDNLKENEVLSGLTKSFFKNRRQRVISKMLERNSEDTKLKPLAEMEDQERNEFVMIVASASDKLMSSGTYYPFVQDSNFHYLTGFVEPDSILVVSTVKGLPFPQHKATLYVSERDEANEMVTGFRAGTELAKQLTGVDETKDIESLAEDIKQYAKSNFKIWGDVKPGRIGNMSLHSRHIHDGIITAVQNEAEIFALSPLIQQIRGEKTHEEVDNIAKAASLSSEGLLDVMVASGQHRCENYLSSLFEFGCRSRGAEKVFSTSTVVAGGERTIMPHYDQNFGLIEDGALVIASASPRVSGYTSRISRTWPVSGKFSTEQAEIYSIVLDVQNTILNMLKLLGFEIKKK